MTRIVFLILFLLLLVSTPPLLSAQTLEELRDKLAAVTREPSPDLGRKRLSPEEVQMALTAFETAQQILSQDISEEFRDWTVKRKAAALITLAYEQTPVYFPELVQVVEDLDRIKEHGPILMEAERHLLMIATQLAIEPMKTEAGKTISMALKPLAERMVLFAQENPGQEADRIIRFFLSALNRSPLPRQRDRQLALVVPIFFDYFATRNDREGRTLSAQLLRDKRRLELPGQAMQLNGYDLEGRPFDATKLKGKVVLVQFWGTWCQPCLQELPLLVDLYKKHQRDGLEIVGINTGVRGDERADTVRQFVEKRELSWPILHEGFSVANRMEPISQYYGITELPWLVLMGRNGKTIAVNPPVATLGLSIQEALDDVALDDLTDEEKTQAREARKKQDEAFNRDIQRELDAFQQR